MLTEKELSALIAEHGVWLSAFLRGLTRCEADAEDSFQEVWLKVIKGNGPKAKSSTRAYLVQIARSVVIDRFRRNGRYSLEIDATQDSPLLASLVDKSPTPAKQVESSFTHEDVLAAIRALPDNLRLVMLMRIEGELTFQEIANELNTPLGTVLTWMRSATKKLKERFANE